MRQLRDLFADITAQVRAARARGLGLEATRRAVDLDAWRRCFAGDSPVRDALFRRYVVEPAVASAWNAGPP